MMSEHLLISPHVCCSFPRRCNGLPHAAHSLTLLVSLSSLYGVEIDLQKNYQAANQPR